MRWNHSYPPKENINIAGVWDFALVQITEETQITVV